MTVLHNLFPKGFHDLVLYLAEVLSSDPLPATPASHRLITTSIPSESDSVKSSGPSRAYGSLATTIGLSSSLRHPSSLLRATPAVLSDQCETPTRPGAHPNLASSNQSSPNQLDDATLYSSPVIVSRQLPLISTERLHETSLSLNRTSSAHGALESLSSRQAFLQMDISPLALSPADQDQINEPLTSLEPHPNMAFLDTTLCSDDLDTSSQAQRPLGFQKPLGLPHWIRDLPDPHFQKCLLRATLLSRTVDLVLALEELRRKGVHTIISPENVLMNDHGHLVISSNDRSKDATTSEIRTQASASYCAPEILLGSCSDYGQSDVWNLGVVLFEMHSRLEAPYFSCGAFEGEGDVVHCVQHKAIDFKAVHCQDARSLIRKLLERDPKKRPSLLQIKAHPYFRGTDWARESRRYRAQGA